MDGASDPDGSGAGGRRSWCAWCGRALVQPTGAGRPRRYCRQSCRQAAHQARKLAEAAGLGPDSVVVGRREYEELQVRIAALRSAVADVDRIWPATDDATELASALSWLLEHARDV